MNFMKTERTQVPDMSSWLNTKSFAALAKNAMSEAQKTLDRALEIPEDDNQITNIDPDGTPIFNTSSSSQSSVNDQLNEPLAVKKEKSKRMDASAWGSFTGSFFQASDLQSPSETIVSTTRDENPVSTQPIAKAPTSLRKSSTFPINPQKMEEKASSVSDQQSTGDNILEKEEVPVLDAESSSLMEGSGEFDPSFFSESNCEIQLSEDNTVNLLPNESSTSNSQEIGHSVRDFETTKLVVSVDYNDHNELDDTVDMSSSSDRNLDISSEIGNTNATPNLSNSISTMSNSAASSTLTVTSKSSTVGIGNYENVGSESSELNSSLSSSNTTLFAPKASVASSDERGEISDGKSLVKVDGQSQDSKFQPLNSTSEIIDNEKIIYQPNKICDTEEETEINVIDVKSDEEDSNGSVSNLLANAMGDDDSQNRMINKAHDSAENEHQHNHAKQSQNNQQISPPNSQCSSIESSSKSYELIKHASMVSLQASTSSSFNVISKFSTNDETFQQNPIQGRVGPNSSEYTSGDELELATTATSSDIEVISSPILGSENGNGHRLLSVGLSHPDSPRKAASNQVIVIDRKLKEPNSGKQGHARSSSEISGISACSDSADSTKPDTASTYESRTNKFQKKINDLNELLEAREHKLVELSKQNMDLQEQKEDLISQVKEARKINSRLSETHLSSEEFTQRLSSMEQRLHQTISERDSLREENKKMRHESATRMSHGQVDEILAEKEEIITDLRAEGESLSKKVGKQSEAIKKIRQTEKTLEKDLKNTKEKLEKKVDECDRLKKSLAAKGEMETKQIEAVRDLTNANTTWQEEAKKRDSELEDAKDQAAALKLSLESAFKEMAGLKKTLAERDDEAKEEELMKVQKLKKELQEELRRNKELAMAETDILQRTIDELRCTLADEERASARREEHLRRERDDIQQRLAMSDARHDELSGSVSTATRPLLRQIESLQLSLSEAQANADRAERGLGERLQQTTIQLASSQERERATAEQYRQVSARLATMDSRLDSSKQSQCEAEARAEMLSADVTRLEAAIHKESVALKALKNSFAEEVAELKKERDGLETAFESEKLVSYEEKRKVDELYQQLLEKDKKLKEVSERDLENLRRMSENANRNSISPTPSISSMSQKGHSFDVENENEERGNHWMEDMFETSSVISMSGGRSIGGASAAIQLEALQANLKQKQGTIIQQQMEVADLERTKEGLNRELAKVTRRADLVDQLEEQIGTLQNQYTATEQKYQTMLTMYGEKVEEAEELRLDLADVKEMYKTQIQELLNSGSSARAAETD